VHRRRGGQPHALEGHAGAVADLKETRKQVPMSLHHLGAVAAVLVLLAPGRSPAENPPAKPEEAQKLIAVLKSQAGLFEKAKAGQTLAVIGGKDAVPALAALLGDEKLAHYARFGLEPNPDPAAGEALREALGKLEGKLLVGAINSVGARRDAAALEALVKLE